MKLVFVTIHFLNPLPDDKILDWSKLKQSADDNFEFDVNSKKFCKLVENTVDKGEIARYEQFLIFPQCFQKACFQGASKGVIVWECQALFHFLYSFILLSCMSNLAWTLYRKQNMKKMSIQEAFL